MHEQPSRRRHAPARLDAVQADAVGALGQVEVVAGAHGRDDQAEVAGHLAPQALDPVEQVAPVADEVDEVEGQLELERVDPHLAGQGGGGVDLGGRLDQLLDGDGGQSTVRKRLEAKKSSPPTIRKAMCGSPGTMARPSITTPATRTALCWRRS